MGQSVNFAIGFGGSHWTVLQSRQVSTFSPLLSWDTWRLSSMKECSPLKTTSWRCSCLSIASFLDPSHQWFIAFAKCHSQVEMLVDFWNCHLKLSLSGREVFLLKQGKKVQFSSLGTNNLYAWYDISVTIWSLYRQQCFTSSPALGWLTNLFNLTRMILSLFLKMKAAGIPWTFCHITKMWSTWPVSW